jgi:hypothetical protein
MHFFKFSSVRGMRFIFVPISVGYAVDPCWFVGLRFAKTESHCDSSVCTGFGYDFEEETFLLDHVFTSTSISFTCEAAKNLMDSHLERLESNEPLLSVSEIVSNIQEIIIPYVHDVLYREELNWPTPVFNAMRQIDCTLMSMMRLGNDDWTSNRNFIVNSDAFKSLVHVWKVAADWSENVPQAVDILGGLTAELTHFFLSVLASLGPIDDGEVFHGTNSLTMSALNNEVNYRDRDSNESLLSFPDISTLPSDEVLMFASSIEIFLGHPEHPNHADAKAFVGSYIEALPLRRSFVGMHATEALLHYQFDLSICPKLLEIIWGDFRGLYPKKILANLVVNCSFLWADIKMALTASISAGSELRGHPLLDSPEIEGLVQALLDPDFPWITGLGLFQCDNAASLASQALDKFIEQHRPVIPCEGTDFSRFATRDDFSNLEEFESTMKGLGRAIGFCIRARVPFAQSLKLPASLLLAIAGDLEEHDSPIIEICEPAFFIRRGIVDSIGPGGMYIFTTEQWLTLTSR